MLTDLTFLKQGELWPPLCERERLKKYKTNKELFEGEHAEVYAEDLKRIERVMGNFDQVVSYPVILNYQKLMSLKVADLLFGERPQISAGGKDSPEQETISYIVDNSNLFNIVYQAAIDISRYGDGLLYIRSNGNNGIIELTQPKFWFPVVSTDNIKSITNHVLAWRYSVGDIEYLKTQVHYKGYYEQKVNELIKTQNGYVIGRQVEATQAYQTGLDDFAIIQISNITTSDRCTGIDDYSDIESIVSELIVRLGQVSKILDKHAEPSMSGPMSALEQDPVTGEYRLKSHNYFIRDSKDDSEVNYITWNGQLEANFKEIERLTNMLYTLSEMGGAIFGDLITSGNVTSAKQLRLTMNSVLAKVNRIRMRVDPALKKALRLCSQLGGSGIINLNDIDIDITWQDGLPSDPKEEAEIINIRTAGKATMSQKRALMQYDNLSSDMADEELQQIQDDEALDNPLQAPFGG